MTTVREATYDVLRKLNIKTMFGNPGSTEESFLENFPDDFTYIETLHEASAVGAADGYAQGMREVGLVNVHTAAGLSNAMSNILTASQNKTPIIITAGNQTRKMLLNEPWLTNVDPITLPKPFVKWSYQPVRAEDVPSSFIRAYAMAIQEPAGPVFLSIPLDDWDHEISTVPDIRYISQKVAPDPKEIKKIAERINQSKHPVLILGSDIARDEEGWDSIIDLVEKINAPVWAAPASERTPFPENHPLYMGALPFAIEPLNKKISDNDYALVIGASVFRYYPYVSGNYLPENLKLNQIINDPYDAAKSPVGDSLVSNASLAIKALIPLVKTHQGVIERSLVTPDTANSSSNTSNDKVSPVELFVRLRKLMPKDTILVEESPSNLGDLHKAWSINSKDSFYTFASGSLGWNLPASVGLSLAERVKNTNRAILSIIGDGSFQYSVQGLWTAAQHNLPILFVVPKNEEYAILKSFAIEQKTANVPGLDINKIDISAIAKGYGCNSIHIKTLDELDKAVSEFLNKQIPTVIEIDISKSIPSLI